MSKRIINLDIIRLIAICSVISFHFFVNTNFNTIIYNNTNIIFIDIIKTLSMICIPLFLLLTGYLNNNILINKRYIYKLFKLILIYIIVSIIILLYKKYYLKLDYSIFKSISSIIDFSINPYAWYFKMYIILYLLIPFLNKLWNILEFNEKKYLIIILFIFSILPTITNIFNFGNNISDLFIARFENNIIISNYFTNLYIFTYYFIGKYLYDNINKYNIKKSMIIIIITLLLSTIFTYYRCYDDVYRYEEYVSSWGGIVPFLLSINIFIIIYKIKINCKLNKILKYISNHIFTIYLISFMVDNYIYNNIDNNIFNIFKYHIFIVLLVFIISFILSIIINYICDKIILLIKKIKNRSKLCYNMSGDFMSLFKPWKYYKGVFDIDYDKIKKENIKILIFDLDNTLATVFEEVPNKKVLNLLKKLEKDFNIVIVSNNNTKRVNKYIDNLNVYGVPWSFKPSTKALRLIKDKFKCNKKEMCIIGDQLVTDVLSGNRYNIKTILTDPLEKKDLKITSFNRFIEKIILKKMKKKNVFERGKYYG